MTAPGISTDPLRAAGLPAEGVTAWHTAIPRAVTSYEEDRRQYSKFWERSQSLIDRMPRKAKRNDAEQTAARLIADSAREARERFLRTHAATVYERLTDGRTRFVRVEDLVYDAAVLIPGLTPTRAEVAADSGDTQGDKNGVEIDQGIFISHVLADERAGLHLCHAMLLPCEESAALLAKLNADGTIDLGTVHLHKIGNAIHVTAANPRFLNAEDDTTLTAMELAVDTAILDPGTTIAVLRGTPVNHQKYGGRRVFGAGINLTHLYRGRIPFLWFIRRDMGYVHKIYRGVAMPDAIPNDVHGHGIEKQWIAVVDAFAIGGHCQLLLVMDHVIATDDAIMTLPARKEGIIPGFANLRLPRFVGERIARQAIQGERQLACASPEGRLIVDELASPSDMDAAISRAVESLSESGAVGAIGNRRAFRLGQEPLDLFRRYCSLYAREQAFCHFSPALIDNLERNWNARTRSL